MSQLWAELGVRAAITALLGVVLVLADRYLFGLDWVWWIWALVAFALVFFGSIVLILSDEP